jgi:hypothetical protein
VSFQEHTQETNGDYKRETFECNVCIEKVMDRSLVASVGPLAGLTKSILQDSLSAMRASSHGNLFGNTVQEYVQIVSQRSIAEAFGYRVRCLGGLLSSWKAVESSWSVLPEKLSVHREALEPLIGICFSQISRHEKFQLRGITYV